MKVGLVTKAGKKNKSNLTKIDDDAMSENCDTIVIFTICGQFGAISNADSGDIVYKTYIFIKSNFLSYKN